MSAMSDGNLDEAIKLFGEAMECNPQSAVLYAKRAQILVNINVFVYYIMVIMISSITTSTIKLKGVAFKL